ncbi:MAG: DUF1295 domain-containing protein [Polyangiaceae bacterium]|nr:DUF1295 domain-containing protein [Polyangiaceae bacterium]
MTEAQIHHVATIAEIVLAAATFIALFFITAPYGRHRRSGFGPEIGQRLSWILMEFPASVGWAVIYFTGRHAFETVPFLMLLVWQTHYVHRTFIFPFRIQASGKTTPVTIVASAIVFNTLNAYVNARWVSEHGSYPSAWLTSPQFVIGVAMFFLGFGINVHADNVLLALRRNRTDGGYAVPQGGLYRYVSCPNYLGEIIEWVGWAVLTWSLAGAAFALYTAANLVPRAISHHRWYKERFSDYPADRRALVPLLL